MDFLFILFNAFMITGLSTLAFIFYNNGLFSTIKPFRDKIPKMTIVGFRFRGTYQKKKVAFRVIKKRLIDIDVAVRYCGLYFDNPEKTPADKQRSFIGAIILDPTEENLAKIKENLEKLDLEIVEVEEQKDGLHANHSIGTIFRSISISSAPMRVNSAIIEYLYEQPELKKSDYTNYEDKNIPRIEIYN